MYCVLPVHAVVIDAYPNNATVEQGTTLVLVCRVVGVQSTTVLSYQWTCPGALVMREQLILSGQPGLNRATSWL